MDTPNYAGQGTMVYAPQISDDGRQFPNFDGLSAKWDTGAEYVALFPNVLLGVHRDHYFAIILTPDGPEKTIEQIELYYTTPHATTDRIRYARHQQRDVAPYLPKIFKWLKGCKRSACFSI